MAPKKDGEYTGGVSKRLTMDGSIHKAYKVLLHLINPKFMKNDAQIPKAILQGAKGIAFITVLKAGFVFGGSVGSGIVIAKLPNGQWSGPSSIGVGGMGWGLLIGASATDSVIILNTDLAVKAFSGKGQVKFGGNISVAAGPVGREADASVNVGDGGMAPCYSYSHSRGLFGGISLQGAILGARDSDNAKFYGRPVTPAEILKGQVSAPGNHLDLQRLYEQLRIIQNPNTEDYSRNNTSSNMTAGYGDNSAQSFHAAPAFEQQASYAYNSAPAADSSPFAQPVTGYANNGSSYQPSSTYQQPSNTYQQPMAAAIPVAKPLPAKAPAKLPPGWVEVFTDDGEPYYWNEKLNVTQWDKPVVKENVPGPPPRRKMQQGASSSLQQSMSAVEANPFAVQAMASALPTAQQQQQQRSYTTQQQPPQNTATPFAMSSQAPVIPTRSSQAPVIPTRTASLRQMTPVVPQGMDQVPSSIQQQGSEQRKFGSPNNKQAVPVNQFRLPAPGAAQLRKTNIPSNTPSAPSIPARDYGAVPAGATAAATSSVSRPSIPTRDYQRAPSNNPFEAPLAAEQAAQAQQVVQQAAPVRQRRYSVEDVQQGRVPGLDSTSKEQYLTEDEFAKVFQMSVSEFEALPAWKRQNLKRQVGLF